MPVYHCSIPEAQLDDAKRERIASEITRIHCAKTGAPPEFAHVLFADAPAGASVVGSIRAGRSGALRAEMADAMAEAVTNSLGLEPGQVRVTLLEVPASWVMEGGAVMPEPGDEAAWLERHARKGPGAQ
jgi:phenylpyruvate tautomerase PptA (4-oxalocrotonate tautomerase family)